MFSMRSVHQISYCPMEQRWVMFKSNMPSLSLCPNYKRHQNTPCSVTGMLYQLRKEKVVKLLDNMEQGVITIIFRQVPLKSCYPKRGPQTRSIITV